MNTHETRKWWIFAGGSLMIFLINVDATIVNLALATISKEMHTSLAQIQWIINSYLLATVILFIVGGKSADTFGPKKVFLIGTVFFTVGSLVAGLATNFPILIIGRLLQGVGFAFTLSLALLMITNAFPTNQRGFIMGLAITITGLGLATGPTLGGAILAEFNWHWIFLFNIPFAIFSFIIIAMFVQPKARTATQQKIDIFGTLILGAAITVLLLTFNSLTHADFNFKLFIIGSVISLVIFILFYFKEIKTQYPLVDFKLFKQRDYALSIGIRFLFMYGYGAFLFFIPLYLQNMLGFSALEAGLMILVFSAIFAICSPMAGIWCDLTSYKPPIIFSSLTGLLAFAILGVIGVQTSIYLVLLGLFVYGICAGIMIPSTVNSTVSSLPVASRGEGLGMFFTVAFIGTSLGVAISGAIVNLISNHNLSSHQQLLSVLNPQQLNLLHHVANGTQPIARLKAVLDPSHFKAIRALAQQSFIKGLTSVMWLNAIFAGIMALLGFALVKRSKSTT